VKSTLIILGVLVVLSYATTLDAQYDFKLSDEEGAPEESVTVTVSLDNSGDPLEGWEFDVCHDDSLIDIDIGDISSGADVEDLDFDVLIVTIEESGWSISAVLDSSNTLDTGDDLELYLATYELLEEGTAELSFCGDYLESSVTVDGEETTPDTESGSIEIAFPDDDDDEPYLLSLSEAAGGALSVSVNLSGTGDAVEAYEFDVCHDDDIVTIGLGDVESGAAIEDLEFESHIFSFEEGGWSVAAVLDGDSLDPTDGLELYLATYEYLEEDSFDLGFCGDILESTVTSGLEEFEPLTEGITVLLPAYVLSLTDAAGEVGDIVDMRVELDIDSDGSEVAGWKFGVCHEEDDLAVDEVTEGSVFDTYEYFFFSTVTDDDGVTVGCLLDFGPDDSLPPGDSYELLVIAYEIDAVPTEVSFCDTLGDPATPVEVIAGTEPIEPRQFSGTVSDSSGLTFLFLRGDGDGNGTVSTLTDALFLLRWAFADGDDPLCMDAADYDDSGEVGALVDALYLLRWAFATGDEPPDPGTETCGEDPTDDDIDCETVADECL